MFKVAETRVNFDYPEKELEEDSKDSEALWDNLNENFNKTLPFIEQTINRWNN